MSAADTAERARLLNVLGENLRASACGGTSRRRKDSRNSPPFIATRSACRSGDRRARRTHAADRRRRAEGSAAILLDRRPVRRERRPRLEPDRKGRHVAGQRLAPARTEETRGPPKADPSDPCWPMDSRCPIGACLTASSTSSRKKIHRRPILVAARTPRRAYRARSRLGGAATRRRRGLRDILTC